MKWLTDLMKKMDKTKWLIVGLCGVLLLVIALPVDSTKDRKEGAAGQTLTDGKGKDAVQSYKNQLEEELERILGSMDGAGKVRVMITFRDDGNEVVEKDLTRQKSQSEETQYQEETVYDEQQGHSPYISRREVPAVEGVLVVAQGGGNARVKQNILDAVLALFPIDAHKVQIVKLKSS